MSNWLLKRLNTPYPQNYILRHPYGGALVGCSFFFLFTIIYRPLSISPKPLGFEVTMAIYSLGLTLPLVLVIKSLKRLPYYSTSQGWTLSRELTIEAMILFIMSIYTFLIGFILEAPSTYSWNLHTFWSSCKSTFLLGVPPYLFFTVQNYKYLLSPDRTSRTNALKDEENQTLSEKQKIQINSKLKKDNLSFYPHEFLYAESDGNYVIFYLIENQNIHKKVIRNSITNVESQFDEFPHMQRTHRAFIINLKKVTQKQGNASGYRLTLEGTDAQLPVSRQNVTTFDQIWEPPSR